MGKIKIPKDMDDAKALGTVLSKYKDTYYTQVLVAYFATYVLYPWRKQMGLLRENTLYHTFVSCCSDLVQTVLAAVIVCETKIQYFVGEWVQYFTKSTENSLADNGSDQVLPVLDHGISASMTSILDAQCQTFSCSNFRQNIAKYQQISVLNN